jgi:nucleotide-binding universal stress UspA family protein
MWRRLGVRSFSAMDRIIIGADETAQSRDALSLGAKLAERLGCRVTVAAAIDYAPLPIDHMALADYDAARRAHFDRVFARADDVVGAGAYERRELDASPARGLNDLAEAEGADLIVLGSTHRGRAGRVYPGSVGEKLLQGSPCAVAIAPSGYARREHPDFSLIGVGYDGERDSRFALAEADLLAAQLHAQLRIITVVPVYPALDRVESAEAREAEYQTRLDHATRRLVLLDAEPWLDQGDPAQVLARQGVDLDLLIVGSRGYGPVRRTLLGSVGTEVIRTAPCPVLVIPRAATRGRPEVFPAKVALGTGADQATTRTEH